MNSHFSRNLDPPIIMKYRKKQVYLKISHGSVDPHVGIVRPGYMDVLTPICALSHIIAPSFLLPVSIIFPFEHALILEES